MPPALDVATAESSAVDCARTVAGRQRPGLRAAERQAMAPGSRFAAASPALPVAPGRAASDFTRAVAGNHGLDADGGAESALAASSRERSQLGCYR
jgi:hypothetical protein